MFTFNITNHYHGQSEAQQNQLVALLGLVRGDLQTIIAKENLEMATLAEFQAKIDTINANTTASAAAAQQVAASLAALRAQLDQVLTDAGVPASVEADILAKLDTAAGASGDLKTFLEATASTPTGPEPPPVGPTP